MLLGVPWPASHIMSAVRLPSGLDARQAPRMPCARCCHALLALSEENNRPHVFAAISPPLLQQAAPEGCVGGGCPAGG